jgi:hypothetical protein
MFFSGVAAFYPAGTFTSSSLTTCSTAVKAVGVFYVKGAAVGNLPGDSAVDVFFVDWYFKFSAGGSFSTTGPVVSGGAGTVYRQAITGSFGGRAAATGKAVVTVISAAGTGGASVDAFRVSAP